MNKCTSECIGVFDDLSKLMETPAKHNDYAFCEREPDPYEIAGKGIGDFYSMYDRYVYNENSNRWEFEYTLAKHDEEKEIEYKIAKLQEKLKRLNKVESEVK